MLNSINNIERDNLENKNFKYSRRKKTIAKKLPQKADKKSSRCWQQEFSTLAIKEWEEVKKSEGDRKRERKIESDKRERRREKDRER